MDSIISINNSQNNPENPLLVGYNLDDFELYFSSDRKVFAHLQALSRMCRVSVSSISNAISRFRSVQEKAGTRITHDVIHARIITVSGFRSVQAYGASTIKELLKIYRPELTVAFEDFGVNEALATMAGVPLPNSNFKLPTTAELLQLGADAAKREELVDRYYENKWESYFIEQARSGIKALPSGELIPVKEILNRLGVVLNRQDNHKFFTRLIVCCDAHDVHYLKAGVPRRNKQGKLKALSSNHYDSSVVAWAELLLTDLQAA